MLHIPRLHTTRVVCVVMLILLLPLSGCLGNDGATVQSSGDAVAEASGACTVPAEATTQNMTVVLVDGVERQYRLTVPAADAGVALPIIIAFHGGGGAEEDFPQQNEFDALAQEERFIMAYAIAEDDRTAAEGEWFLNTAATSREDNNYTEAIVDALSELYCIDDTRLYAVGYSLGSMFTYEVACQLNHRFAAVASFAGTMPVAPETCDLTGSMAVMHVHGKLDMIIDYDDDWDWKDGEHEGVGTMSNIPGMIDAWGVRADCSSDAVESTFTLEHIIHHGCSEDVRIEHYGIEFQGHGWPDQVNGTETYRLMWNFLSEFTHVE